MCVSVLVSQESGTVWCLAIVAALSGYCGPVVWLLWPCGLAIVAALSGDCGLVWLLWPHCLAIVALWSGYCGPVVCYCGPVVWLLSPLSGYCPLCLAIVPFVWPLWPCCLAIVPFVWPLWPCLRPPNDSVSKPATLRFSTAQLISPFACISIRPQPAFPITNAETGVLHSVC